MAVPTTTTTTASANATSLTITKPSGLAVGDLLVAYITAVAGGTIPIDTPAGWTQRQYDNNQTARKFALLTKVADSADVSASNFSFTTSGGASAMLGVLVRCAGVASGSEVTTSEMDEFGGTSSVSLTGTSTPETTDSLVLMSISGWDISGSATVSGYATTPSNTWTELADINIDQGTIDPFLAVASATSGSISQITNYSATLSGAPSNGAGTLLIVRPPTDATGTNALLSVSPTLFSQSGSSGTTGTNALLSVSPTHFVQSGSATSFPVWSNDTKSSSDWINPDK